MRRWIAFISTADPLLQELTPWFLFCQRQPSHKTREPQLLFPSLRYIGQIVANDPKVSRNTFVQLFCLSSSGIIGSM
jgi:hypothetical protein